MPYLSLSITLRSPLEYPTGRNVVIFPKSPGPLWSRVFTEETSCQQPVRCVAAARWVRLLCHIGTPRIVTKLQPSACFPKPRYDASRHAGMTAQSFRYGSAARPGKVAYVHVEPTLMATIVLTIPLTLVRALQARK